jgi:hypothetical protein
MRINVYSQEITSEVILVGKKADTDIWYHAVRLMLHSSDRLHSPPEDDDRSGITFWLPKSRSRREELATTFEALAKLVRDAPENTGLD